MLADKQVEAVHYQFLIYNRNGSFPNKWKINRQFRFGQQHVPLYHFYLKKIISKHIDS